MARQLRIDFPGALHHVTSRGNERRDIFYDDLDRSMFLHFLGKAVFRFDWSLTAWVLMSNHFHLVVHTPEANLSRGMHWLNGAWAGWFNHRHGRSGHLFQGRFKSFLIEKERYFREVLRYVVLNPVRANMVARPEDYEWSSYRATAGLEPAPGWLDATAVLGLFDNEPASAQRAYATFVQSKLGDTTSLWDELIHGIYLGGEIWAKQMRKIVESRPRSNDHPKVQRTIGRPKMRAILAAVAETAGRSISSIRAMRGGALRRLVAWIGWHEGLLTLHTIAASLLLRSDGHVSRMIRRCEWDFGKRPVLLAQLDQALATLRA